MRRLVSLLTMAGVLELAIGIGRAASASDYQILYDFPAHDDPSKAASYNPQSLIKAPSGSLFGVADATGSNGVYATDIFKLDPPAAGQARWTYSIIHSFSYSPKHGEVTGRVIPQFLIDSAGNIYGGTRSNYDGDAPTLFRLSPPTAGTTDWTTTILFQAPVPVFGTLSVVSLAPNYRDSSGVVLGTSLIASSSNDYGNTGNVFAWYPPKAGGEQGGLSVLTTFNTSKAGNGDTEPFGFIVGQDAALYGTANDAVFRLSRSAPGQLKWAFKNILVDASDYFFQPLIADRSLNIYSTSLSTSGCCSSVYKLSPPQAGQTTWRKSVLHAFTGGDDGDFPLAPLVNWKGILYGVVLNGGSSHFGVVFKLTAQSPGSPAVPWNKAVVHSFRGPPTDGRPQVNNSGAAGPLLAAAQPDGSLALFGATKFGGSSDNGTIYELVP